MTEMCFLEKFQFTLKLAEGPKMEFFDFSQSFIITFCWKEHKMKEIVVICFAVQTPHLGRLLVKMLSSSQSAEFFDYQCHWKQCSDIFDFLNGDIHQKR